MTDKRRTAEEIAEEIDNTYGRKGSWNLFDKKMIGAIAKALEDYRNEGIEEAAKVADDGDDIWNKELWNHIHKAELPSLSSFIANKIRALKRGGR